MRCYSRLRRSCTEAFSNENQAFIVIFSVSYNFFCCAILIIRVERRARMKSTACGFSLVLKASKGKWTFGCNCNAINLRVSSYWIFYAFRLSACRPIIVVICISLHIRWALCDMWRYYLLLQNAQSRLSQRTYTLEYWTWRIEIFLFYSIHAFILRLQIFSFFFFFYYSQCVMFFE